MSKQVICWFAFVLLLVQAGLADEVARWDFEETSGMTAADQSGQLVVNLAGSDSLAVEGKFGSGIDFAGDGGATMDAAASEIFRFTEDFSIVLWINSDVPVADYTRFVDMSAADGGLADSYRLMTGNGGSSDNFRFMSRQSGSNTSRIHTRDLVPDTWTLLVARHDLDGEVTLNVLEESDPVDAAFVGTNAESWPTLGPIDYAEGDLKIGRLIGGGRKFEGQMDGIAFYDHLLTDAEIATIFNKPPGSKTIAASPTPSDVQVDVLREVRLSWAPSESAQTHDVYLGTAYEDVNNASPANPLDLLRSEGQDANSLDVGVLEYGQTYYWRVDEVNGAPDYTVFKGDVWSFEIEPLSLAITGITATASSAHDDDMLPEKTIDGSGLDALDQHSNEPTDMWLSGMGDLQPSIQYEFDRIYKLHEMWVWNSNQAIESFVGLGAKDVTIEISTNGADWTLLEGTPPLAQAPGQPAYAHNTTIDLGGVMARYVRLTIMSGHGMLPQRGLSELRFFYIPTQPREPQPAHGAAEVAVDTLLSWRAGREAASHQVSLSTDPDAVGEGVEAVDTVDASYDPGALDLASTYYWQVIEVNEAETPAAHAGDIWSFSTQEFLVVDDFEGYNNSCARIFFAWEDGLGHNGGEDVEDCDVPPSNGNGGGSIVGHAQAPFAERSVVHSGSQSMPLAYDNAFGPSEAILRLDSQDWTAHGIKSLALFFRGDPSNTGQLYLKINNTKISYNGIAGALQRAQWLPWNIDLSTVGGNLQSVTSLTIGVDGATASGMLYVDDIRLYPLPPELITPVDPDPANLVAYYAFDGDARDSVGGLHGTLVGNASFVPGQQGQAISLNTITVTDYVDIVGYQGLLGAPAITVATWIKTDTDATGAIIGWGPNVAGQRFGFRIDAGRLRTEHAGGNVQGDSPVNDGSWHHVAVTVQADATVSYPAVQLWLDGQDNTRPTTDPDAYDLTADLDVSIGRRPASDDRYFIGEIDELYIYNRVLSPAEIAGLAGLPQPFDKPFE